MRFTRRGLAIFGFIFLLAKAPSLQATILSDNLFAGTAFMELVNSGSWIAASFATGNSGYTLTSATPLMQEDTPGTVRLALYSDSSSGTPGNFVGALENPTSFSSSLTPTTFGGNSLFLPANHTYWLVLSTAGSGQYEWAYASDNTGSGPGFLSTWGSSGDGGTTWQTSSDQPMQMQVQAAVVTTPEPTAFLLLALGISGLCVFGRRTVQR